MLRRPSAALTPPDSHHPGRLQQSAKSDRPESPGRMIKGEPRLINSSTDPSACFKDCSPLRSTKTLATGAPPGFTLASSRCAPRFWKRPWQLSGKQPNAHCSSNAAPPPLTTTQLSTRRYHRKCQSRDQGRSTGRPHRGTPREAENQLW